MDPSKSVWTERWRPKKVIDMVGDGSIKELVTNYLKDEKAIPHFLLYSKTPGTGKTTLAKAIINELGCDALILNSSDDRKIETIRDKVKEFAMTKSSQENKRRCVFLDEFDGMLKASQEALRNIMETYVSNVFFILTANNINKVIDPLKSRCKIISFAYPKKEEILQYLITICKGEDLQYDEAALNELINLNYPSIRNCVISLQDIKTAGKTVVMETIKANDDEFMQYYALLKANKWRELKQVVIESRIDTRELNTFFWKKALDEDNLKVIQICCRNEKDIAWGADPKIVFVTSIIELCR